MDFQCEQDPFFDSYRTLNEILDQIDNLPPTPI